MAVDYTLRNGDKIIRCNYSPYLYIKKVSGEHLILPVDINITPQQMGLSPDGSTFVISTASSPYVTVYETVNWTQLGGMTEFPNYRALVIKFSADSSMFALGFDNFNGTNHNLIVYKTSDLSKFPEPQFSDQIYQDVNDVAFSPDGTMIACGSTDNTDTVAVYNIADGSKMTLTGHSTSADCWCVEWSLDGTELYYGIHLSTNSVRIMDTSTWTLKTNPVTQDYARDISLSPDGTRVAVSSITGNEVEMYDLPSWTRSTVLSVPIEYSTTNAGNKTNWIDNDFVLVCTVQSTPGYLIFNQNTGEVIEQDLVIYSMLQALTMQASAILYEINGTIDESLVADSWIAIAYDLETGNQIASSEFTGTSFSIKLNRNGLCTVTVSAKQGNSWEPSLVGVNVGDKIIPTTPSTIPYYYIATVGGSGDVTEPVWPVTPSSTVVDGSITWELVEKLIQPVTHSPIVPTVIV